MLLLTGHEGLGKFALLLCGPVFCCKQEENIGLRKVISEKWHWVLWMLDTDNAFQLVFYYLLVWIRGEAETLRASLGSKPRVAWTQRCRVGGEDQESGLGSSGFSPLLCVDTGPSLPCLHLRHLPKVLRL